jgi:Rad3-related DNA helicase
MLIDRCCVDVSDRFLFQGDFNTKTDMLAMHARSKDTIIVAPAMHEGIDLVDGLSRFQIICKVPFPNQFEDKQLAARVEHDPAFYDWLTALKLVQCSGRSVRHEDDYATTYILDSSFGWWHKRNQKLLPAWFKEALKY